MRILQIIQKPQRRGAEIFACQLSLELQSMGHHVDVVYLFENESFELDFKLNFISIHANPSKRFSDFKSYKKLARLIRKGNYDIVQANAGDTLKYAAISRMLYRWETPLVFRNANKMSAFIRGSLHRWLNLWFLKKCDFYISVSENCRQDLIGLLPTAADRSETITIGTYSFNAIEKVEEHSRPVLINIGSLVPEKNHAFLLKTFHKLVRNYPNALLWIFGEGKERMHLTKLISSLEIEQNVILWGNRPDVISYLKAADVMVMPSLIEGLPGVILEAMSCGVPVVAAPVGGIPEVVKNNETGFTIHDYNDKVYEDIIVKILEDPTLQQRISASAKEEVKKNYLMPVIAAQFADCYQKLIDS